MTDEGVLISPPPASAPSSDSLIPARSKINVTISDPLKDHSNNTSGTATTTNATTQHQQTSTQTPQQQAYQEQANNYVKAENYSSDAIQQTTNTNLAEINAAAEVSQFAGSIADMIAQKRKAKEEREESNKAANAELKAMEIEQEAELQTLGAKWLKDDFDRLSDFIQRKDTIWIASEMNEIAITYQDLHNDAKAYYWHEKSAALGNQESMIALLHNGLKYLPYINDTLIYYYTKIVLKGRYPNDNHSYSILTDVADWYYDKGNCESKKIALQYYLWYIDADNKVGYGTAITHQNSITYKMGLIYKNCMAVGDSAKKSLNQAIYYFNMALIGIDGSISIDKQRHWTTYLDKAEKENIERSIKETRKQLKRLLN